MNTENGNGHSVGLQRAKKTGGVTGKGFKPGQSGNPTGKNTRRETKVFGIWLRSWVEKNIKLKDPDGKIRKIRRLDHILERIVDQKPDVILHYAYGKPVEMIELSGAEGGAVDFVVKVRGELP